MPPTKSRLSLARPAIRPAMWGRVMLAGPSGAGKTWTALLLAETLVAPEGKTLVVDTEKESALTYSDEFTFEHIAWQAPFDPRELTDTLKEAGNDYECVIIDSFTHFWRGTGGILDIANGKFTGWADARPAQVDVVEAILHCDAHVIVCVREKQAYAQVADGKGGWKVEKMGMEAIQDDQLEYEVNVSVSIDMQHKLQIAKSRTNAVPVGTVYHAGHAADFAVQYRDWLAAGEPTVSAAKMRGLIDAMDRIDDRAERVKAKGLFVQGFGRPEFLLASRFDEAAAWVADVVLAANGGPVAGAATQGADTAQDQGQEAPQVPAAAPQPATERVAAPAAPEPPTPPQEPAPEAHPDPIAADRVAKYEAHVAKLTPTQVRQQLLAQGGQTNGTPKTLRARLVGILVAQAASAEAAANA